MQFTVCALKIKIMSILLILMLLALLIPIYKSVADANIWQKLLALGSVSGKVGVIMLFVSVLRDDWLVGIVGIFMLGVGNAGFMLIAQIIRRMQ